MNYRMEKDSLGAFKVPADAYYGIFTARARENFNLTGDLTHPVLIRVLAVVKSAAARANMELGVLDKKKAQAIIRAADEVIRGKFDDQFCLDMIQAGAGTPFNMNTNEVLANRANELLGGKKGKYNFVNPNDDVNMGQSSNNVIPTAVRISTLILLQGLLEELNAAEKSLAKKSKEFDRIVKVGRTHIQDAVPVRLGQEFDSYREIVRRGINNLLKCGLDLSELGIGGTAIGTGITAHPKFDQLTASHISKMTGLKFHATPQHVYLTQSMAAFGNFASALSVFCSEL
ncbi:MAG: aspartate ammonia-lyase, partial [candidate division Zixibacteria bacterium]|nr:aspartate ammonia-lyase [candidate division Zixibacteria bacterium]